MSALTGVLICLFLQALFSGTEMSIISCNRHRMRHFAEEGDLRAKWVLDLIENPQHLLATTLVGVNVSVVLGSILMEYWINSQPHLAEHSAVISALILTPFVLLLGEIIPMSIFLQHSAILARLMVLPIRAAYYLLFPLVFAASLFAMLVARAFGQKVGGRVFVNREELELLISEGMHREGPSAEDQQMIAEIFDFSETVARNVMVPLIDVVAAPVTATVGDAVALMGEKRHSRIPIYEDRVDNIVGLVRATDLVAFNAGDSIRMAMYRPYLVPETKSIEDVLGDFRVNQRRMGIVIDEFGGCSGIITLEDIVEEIVGEITDEHGVGVEADAKVVGDWIEVDGNIRVYDLNEEFDLHIPEGDYESLAGFLILRSGRIPQKGERFVLESLEFHILEATERRVERVAIRRAVHGEPKPPIGK